MIWPHFREWVLRLQKLGGRKQLDQDIEDELAFHVAMREEKKVCDGLNPPTAQMEARRELGGIEKWKEALRDVRRPRLLENFFSDVSLAVRLLRKSPAFTLVALGTLTLAIGANTAVFTLLDTLMLKPLPVPQADRLTLWRVEPTNDSRPSSYSFSYGIFRDLERHSAGFSDVFAFSRREFELRTETGTQKVPGTFVSGHYFSALGVPPAKGRWIGPADDQPGGGKSGPAVVISDRFWKMHFNGDAHIIGREVTLNHLACTVVGTMPPNFFGAEVGQRPDVYVPVTLEPQMDAPFNLVAAGYRAWWLQVGARLREGASLTEANAMLQVRSKNVFAAEVPDSNWSFDGVKRPNLYVTAEEGATGFCDARFRFRKPLLIIMALVVLVLCVACLNLASLLMARSATRERELATRSALGAGRGRLLQQLFTESLLLAGMATVLGFVTSLLFSHLLVGFLTRPRDTASFDVTPDIRVFAFVAAAAGLSAVLIGIIPALKATGQRLQGALKEGEASVHGAKRRYLWPRLLTGSEIALASLLVTGAGLLDYSLVLLHTTSLGFQAQGVTVLSPDASKQQRNGEALFQLYQEFAAEVSRLPDVKDVSYTFFVPLSGGQMFGNFTASGGSPRQLNFDL